MVSRQALLWQRLLPNPTYEPGILLGLILTVGPVIIFLDLPALHQTLEGGLAG